MIRLQIKEACEREGIDNPKELSRRTGLHYQSCYLLWRGESKMVALATLELICTLLGIRPGQLFDFEPASEKLPASSGSSKDNPTKGRTDKKGKSK